MKKIEKALIEKKPEDIVYIGDVAERLYNGAGGDLLRAFVNGFQAAEINRYTHDEKTNSDLKMGRIEGMNMIIEAFERAINAKERLTQERKQEISDQQADNQTIF